MVDHKCKNSFLIENNIVKGPQKFIPVGDAQIGRMVFDTLNKYPNFVGVIDAKTGQSYTYGELVDKVIRCALWLKKEQVPPDDVIFICSYNSIEDYILILASYFIGRTVFLWTPISTSDTINKYIELVNPKIMLINKENIDRVRDMPINDKIGTKIITFGNFSKFESLDDIIKQQNPEEVVKFECNTVNPNDTAVLISTSGSTGVPKVVKHSYETLYNSVIPYINNCLIIDEDESKNVMSSNIPLCSMSAHIQTFIAFLTVSQTILMNLPTAEEICRTVETYKVKHLFLSSDVLKTIVKFGTLAKYNLSSLRSLTIGGTKVQAEVLNVFSRAIPNCRITVIYGSTEGGRLVSDINYKKGVYCGTLSTNVQLKVIDKGTGKTLGQHQLGELCFKKSLFMKGYYNNPEATKETIDSEGWLHSGDVGYYDEEGHVVIVDRLTNMIQCKNVLFSPLEIQEVLLNHLKVMDADVVKVAQPLTEEYPVAFVVQTKNAKVTEEELIELSANLGENKILRRVIFLKEIPHLITSKQNRQELLKIAKTV